MTIFRAIDTETGGFDPAVDELLQIGWRDAILAPGHPMTLGPWFEETFVKNTKPIPLTAKAVHHIDESDLEVAPERKLAVRLAMEGADYFIAHNATFELSFIPELAEKPIVCTYRAALRLLPDLESYSNQYLRYHFGVATSRDEREQLFTHRAGPDAYITALNFKNLLALAPLPELVRISSLPPVLRKFNFGKHRGQPIADIPLDYFAFMDREDFDEETRHTIAVERARRKEGDHETYYEAAVQVLELCESEASLSDWWKREADNRVKHHLLPRAPLYERLVAAGTAKRAALKAAAPQQAELLPEAA